MSRLNFRQQYADPVRDELLGEASAIVFDPEEDRTEQHHRDECDINVMLARMGVSPDRSLPLVTVSNIIKDVTLLPDTLQEAFDIIDRGREHFASLPAEVRAYFLNDPRNFIAASEEELIRSGIPAREPDPVPAPASAPAPTEGAS